MVIGKARNDGINVIFIFMLALLPLFLLKAQHGDTDYHLIPSTWQRTFENQYADLTTNPRSTCNGVFVIKTLADRISRIRSNYLDQPEIQHTNPFHFKTDAICRKTSFLSERSSVFPSDRHCRCSATNNSAFGETAK